MVRKHDLVFEHNLSPPWPHRVPHPRKTLENTAKPQHLMLKKCEKRHENARKSPDISRVFAPTIAQTALVCYTIYI